MARGEEEHLYGAAPAGRPPAQVAEPAPLSNRVTISGLTISRGEIAPAAVDASALADAAVTSRAIADHSVTPSKLSEDAMRQITRAAAASISMVGEVDEAGGVVRGAGFSAQRASTGEYELAFDAPFVAPPVVVAVAQSYGICYVPAAAITTQSVRVKCLSDLLGSAPSAANTRFSFVASATA